MQPSDYDDIPLCDSTLSEVRDYWRNKADGNAQKIRKWLRFMGRLVRPPHHTGTHTKREASYRVHKRPLRVPVRTK
jgi:hypothetical protein